VAIRTRPFPLPIALIGEQAPSFKLLPDKAPSPPPPPEHLSLPPEGVVNFSPLLVLSHMNEGFPQPLFLSLVFLSPATVQRLNRLPPFSSPPNKLLFPPLNIVDFSPPFSAGFLLFFGSPKFVSPPGPARCDEDLVSSFSCLAPPFSFGEGGLFPLPGPLSPSPGNIRTAHSSSAPPRPCVTTTFSSLFPR